jgi:hypothetical protein
VQIIACGTSFYAGSVARYWIEAITGLPCAVEIASEYRYRDAVANPDNLIVTISQSGETLDTMEALKYAKSLGQEHAVHLQRARVGDPALLRAGVLHPRRRRDRRRLHKGLHHAAGGAVHAGGDAGQAEWPCQRTSRKPATWMRCATCPARCSMR